MQIRQKLTFEFTFSVASILMIFSLAVYWFYSYYREEQFYKRLKTKAQITARVLIQVDDVNKEVLQQIDQTALHSLDQEEEIIYNFKNELIFSSLSDTDFRANKEMLDNIRVQGEIYYVQGKKQVVGIIYTDRYNRCVVLARAWDRYGLNILDDLRIILIICNVVAIGAIGILGWFYAKNALYPIASIVKQMELISASNLSLRLDQGNEKDEIAQLAYTFNKMLDRVEYAFEMQKSFVANASHELRTPLTAILGELEVALLEEKSIDEYKESINSALDDIKKLIELTNGLLNLARMEHNNAVIAMEALRLDELVLMALSDRKLKYNEQEVEFEFEESLDDSSSLLINANLQLLRIATGNVIDNACKYSDGQKIFITIGLQNDKVFVEVRDKGIGIAPGDLKYIFTPFFRGNNAKNRSGFGIGLPLAAKIIRLHKGEIVIDSTLGQGTRVVLLFPKYTESGTSFSVRRARIERAARSRYR